MGKRRGKRKNNVDTEEKTNKSNDSGDHNVEEADVRVSTSFDVGMVSKTLEELHKFKLMALHAKLERVSARIREPIRQQKERELKEEIEKAFSQDQEYKEAKRSYVATVNEIISHWSGKLPEGYAITKFDIDQGEIVCEYNPEQSGKLVPMPYQEEMNGD